MHIPAREARIFWNRGGEVAVSGDADEGAQYRHLRLSGGACYGFWRECSTEELYFRLAQQAINMMVSDRVDPKVLHEAFKVIPEWRLMLPPDHPDSLKDKDAKLAEHPKGWSKGYPL